jgi:hypothetical protein
MKFLQNKPQEDTMDSYRYPMYTILWTVNLCNLHNLYMEESPTQHSTTGVTFRHHFCAFSFIRLLKSDITFTFLKA